MADLIIVTYDYQTDLTTPEPFTGSLAEARTTVLDRMGELLRAHPTWMAVPVPTEWRMQCLVERRHPGMAKVTFRISDTIRHCRSCRCRLTAFG